MFSALRHRTAALALGVCFILPVHASSPKPGDFANTQARHIATFFPGRMTGTPAEMLSADYIRQQFQQMGYRSDYVPAADGRRYLAASGKLCDRQPDPGANLLGSLETGVRF